MEQKIVFRERLSELKELADSKENILTRQEIREFFQETPLEESHFSLIFEYLKGLKIQIADDEEEAEDARGTNPGSLTFYMEDLQQTCAKALSALQEGKSVLPPEEELELFHQAFRADRTAKDRLTELYLPVVCEIAEDYEGSEILVEDLIQEGNIGLLTALETLADPESDVDPDSLAACQAHLLNGINKGMEAAILEGQNYHETGEQIAGRVNHLNDAINGLKEELGHKVSVEEISAYLDMPVEEIQDILKMAGDEIEVE